MDGLDGQSNNIRHDIETTAGDGHLVASTDLST
jgi:hypothetical protein